MRRLARPTSVNHDIDMTDMPTAWVAANRGQISGLTRFIMKKEVLLKNWEEAADFFTQQTNTALEAILRLDAQQRVDQMVIGSLLIAHPNIDKAAEAFRQMASEASTNTLLHGIATDTPEVAQAAHSDRITFWSGIFQKMEESDKG